MEKLKKSLKYVLLGGVICSQIGLRAQTNDPQLGQNSIYEIIASMTLDEKVSLVIGTGMDGAESQGNEPQLSVVGVTKNIVPGAAGTTRAIPRLGIPAIVVADGPSGLRIDATRENDKNTYYATAYPIPTALASSWNTNLIEQAGKSVGNEALEYGVDVLLAPALNIHRYPLAGRNYEYYSEDPLISGKTATAFVKGVQSNNVGTSLKHFAANNQETNREKINTIVSQRALREIYLKGFEIAVTEAKPWTVMSSYNKINGTFASQDKQLLIDVLRKDWEFDGAVMTDWFGGVDPVAQMNAENDLLMPGTTKQKESIINAVNEGKLDEDVLDRNVKNILELIIKTPRFKNYKYSNNPDLKAHALVARQLASESMVLLKNNGKTLPLKNVTNIAAFGFNSYDFIPIGAGSGEVNYPYVVSLVEGLNNANYKVDKDLQSTYSKYIVEAKKLVPQPKTFMDPVIAIPEMQVSKSQIEQKADQNDVALISIGRISGEFRDRALTNDKYNIGDYYLSATEKELIKNVSDVFHAKGKKVILILNIGGTIELTDVNDLPDAILLAWQPGMEGGNAIADIISGKQNPSGRLATTFLANIKDASAKTFPGIPVNDPTEITYDEDIFVGYRYYDAFNVKPLYDFGFGLSYTTFDFSNLKVKRDVYKTKVSVTVTNSGNVAGKEVVQLYVSAPKTKVSKPLQELRAFDKTKELKPGESQEITFELKNNDIEIFDTNRSAWIVEPGTYEVRISASSRDVRAVGHFNIDSQIILKDVNDVLAPKAPIVNLKTNN